ncbi:MAG: thioesterase family protein [Acidimicrobiia bacterium]
MNSFYTKRGEIYTPTDYVTGPWDTDHCHAGPPCGLLMHSIHAVDPAMGISRVTFEIERQIPKLPVATHTEILRGGRKVQLVRGQLIGTEGQVYLTAHAWLIRIDTQAAPQIPFDGSLPKPPAECPVLPIRLPGGISFFDAVEIRAASGTPFGGGRATAWMRPRVPLVESAVVSPYAMTALAADSANGVARIAPFEELIAINTDLTVYFARKPVGDWVAIDASTISQGLGLGMTDSMVYDASGFVGRSNQSIFFDAA